MTELLFLLIIIAIIIYGYFVVWGLDKLLSGIRKAKADKKLPYWNGDDENS